MQWRGWADKRPEEPVREGLAAGTVEWWWRWWWYGLKVLKAEDTRWVKEESILGSWSSVSKLQELACGAQGTGG